jgi:hypothetical protein
MHQLACRARSPSERSLASVAESGPPETIKELWVEKLVQAFFSPPMICCLESAPASRKFQQDSTVVAQPTVYGGLAFKVEPCFL